MVFVSLETKAQILAPATSTDWRKGGNTNPGPNVFGTLWPTAGSEIWTVTGGATNRRMVVTNGGSGINGGCIGFGNVLPVGFTPMDRLHSHTTSPGDNFLRFTNTTTGTAATDGVRMGITHVPVGAFGQLYGQGDVALFDQNQASIFRFDIRSNITASTSQLTKMTVGNVTQINPFNSFQPVYTDVARVGIWNNYSSGFNPLAMLHIGSTSNVNNFAHRDWMNIGTYYSTIGSDGMYVGIRETANNGINATIAWGDDGAAAGLQGDRLMFIFNSNLTPGGPFISQQTNGLEVARMVSNVGNDGAALFNGGSIGGTIDPQNTVHIVGPSTLGNALTPGGNSGLRLHFTQANVTPTVTNPGTGVLSVDANGNVIYVPANSGGGGLNACATPINDFVTKFVSPTQVCTTQIYDDGINVGVATTLPGAKFAIKGSGTTAGTTFKTEDNIGLPTIRVFDDGHAFINSRPVNSTGWFFQVDANTGGEEGTQFETSNTISKGTSIKSLQANTYANSTAGALGFVTDVFNSSVAVASPVVPIRNYGLRAQVIAAGNENYGVNVGVGGGNSFTDNYAAWFQATGTGNNNFGGYFTANGATYNEAIRAICFGPGYAANFVGNVNINGTAYYSSTTVITSDQSIKKDVKKIDNALDIITKLSPKTYTLTNENVKQLNFNNAKTQYGLIAQEVEKVIPDIVYPVNVPEMIDPETKTVHDSKTLKGVSYDQLISILVKGIQEQQTQIDELKKIITSNPITNTINGQTVYEVELSDKAAVVLDQNVPNPFAEQTVINFTIPESTIRAQMLFHNTSGQLMKVVDITERGKCSLTVFANDLSNGTYTYTLVVDGKVAGTKKMERQK